jgi:hypothetical protein
MEIFAWATNHDMNMLAKFRVWMCLQNLEYEQAHIFIEKYFKVLFHVILYHVLLSKLE